jgi:hypothetical protein
MFSDFRENQHKNTSTKTKYFSFVLIRQSQGLYWPQNQSKGGIFMDPIKDFLEIVKLAKAQSHQNLVLFPLLAPESGEPDYFTLEEALGQEAVIITEVSEGGQVPELKLVNHSESKVLILDGEELKGAKQNRIVNATFLIGPKSEVVIPVSCVEHGRWCYKSRRFDTPLPPNGKPGTLSPPGRLSRS